jgi:hypothetical protein
MQRELFRRFEKSDETYAEAFDYLCELERRFVYDSENQELEREVRRLRYLFGGNPDLVMGRPPRRGRASASRGQWRRRSLRSTKNQLRARPMRSHSVRATLLRQRASEV